MIPGILIKDQIKRISTFVYILLVLFFLNIIFKINFNWEGIAIIVNIYLYVFSFYLIFNFSLIEIEPLKAEYRNRYKKHGDLILFLVTRILPFAIIYLITVIFTLINYYNSTFWPWRPILELLDGRFSNIVFYSLILLVILKLKQEPRITIPLSLLMSIIYFSVYKFTYAFSPVGLSISLLKSFQITVGLFFLLYEFVSKKKKIFKTILISIFTGCSIYGFLIFNYYMFNTFSRPGSYRHLKSSMILLKIGFSSPLESIESIIVESENPQLLVYTLDYFKFYNYNIMFSDKKWENMLMKGTIDTTEVLSGYIKKRNVTVLHQNLILFARNISEKEGNKLVNANNFINYSSKFYEKYYDDFIQSFNNGNKFFKIWMIRLMKESKSCKSIPLLNNLLTGFDEELAQEAYNSLISITGLKKKYSEQKDINDLEYIMTFKNYYLHCKDKKID